MRFEVRINPLRARPKKTETGLQRRLEVRLLRSHFVQQQREIKRHDSPNQRNVFEGHADQFSECRPIIGHLVFYFDLIILPEPRSPGAGTAVISQ